MIVKLGGEEAVAGALLEMPLARPASPSMELVNRAAQACTYKTQLIARDQKLTSGLSRNAFLGIVAGLISAFIFLTPLILGVI